MLPHIAPSRLTVYRLLAGAADDVTLPLELDWQRSLGLRLWWAPCSGVPACASSQGATTNKGSRPPAGARCLYSGRLACSRRAPHMVQLHRVAGPALASCLHRQPAPAPPCRQGCCTRPTGRPDCPAWPPRTTAHSPSRRYKQPANASISAAVGAFCAAVEAGQAPEPVPAYHSCGGGGPCRRRARGRGLLPAAPLPAARGAWRKAGAARRALAISGQDASGQHWLVLDKPGMPATQRGRRSSARSCIAPTSRARCLRAGQPCSARALSRPGGWGWRCGKVVCGWSTPGRCAHSRLPCPRHTEGRSTPGPQGACACRQKGSREASLQPRWPPGGPRWTCWTTRCPGTCTACWLLLACGLLLRCLQR